MITFKITVTYISLNILDSFNLHLPHVAIVYYPIHIAFRMTVK